MSENGIKILVVDDTENIHKDFDTVLGQEETSPELAQLEAAIFKENTQKKNLTYNRYVLHHAYQGEEAIGKIQESIDSDNPYSVAFIDVRMPPGIDGVETTERIWKIDKDIQVVICTAFSDYSLEEMIKRLGKTDRLLILKKPFDSVEVAQMANALTKKWVLSRYFKGKEKAIEAMTLDRIDKLNKQVESLTRENSTLKQIVTDLQENKN